MSHMIDVTTGTPAIAYAGETPWHGIGRRLTPGLSIEEWTREAGLAYDVLSTPVEFRAGGSLRTFSDLTVLYRSDTGRPLSVVSNRYNPVQPREVMDYFRELTEIGGFTLETAGAIADRKRIWALAKVHDGAPVTGHDVVKPYALLATSYDGTLATTAKLTTIRIVCWNTLSASVGYYDGQKFQRGEDDAGSPVVKVPHRQRFDAKSVRKQLGIYRDAFEKMLIEFELLAKREIDLVHAQNLTARLIKPLVAKDVEPRETAMFARIIDLFDGASIGNDLAGPTTWGWLNSVTQYVDWERGRDSTRLNSAWFGPGDNIKTRAHELALEDIA